MDESWRMRMGIPSLAGRRRASEDLTTSRSAESARSGGVFRASQSASIFDVEDFNDVFGGPPRSVLSRKLSCDLSSYDYFYREIFRRPEEAAENSSRNGRRLPEFRIPSRHRADDDAVFYNDIFESSGNCNHDDDHDPDPDRREKKPSTSSRMWRPFSKSKWNLKSKSKSKSKSNSSSVLSYEEISSIPIQPGIRDREEDAGLTSFASKLRPINVPCRWNSSSAMGGIYNNQTSEAAFQYTNASYVNDDHYPQNEYIGEHPMRCSNPCFSQQFPSPETDIPYSTTMGISVDDVDTQLESPSSANSMFCHDPGASNAKFQFNASEDEDDDEDDVDDDDEVLSSYVIEINSGRRVVNNEAADLDEAIAWAKRKFQGCGSSSSGDLNVRQHESNHQFGEERSMVPLMMEAQKHVPERYPVMPLYMEEGRRLSAIQKENDSSGEHAGFTKLDERINSWSAGRGTNIRLLLSTLHHVLWDGSGWNAIPFSNLTENSQVKKAYQKARLCIHPDKLQQRSANPRQKYIAEKVFSILQNAWDSFISQRDLFQLVPSATG